ncbi:uncharacterized protein ISCGN_021639 [Ixodes scapularis]
MASTDEPDAVDEPVDSIQRYEVDKLESRKYAYLLDLARELGFFCKGNPKKARVIKFIRQSALHPLHEKENDQSLLEVERAVPEAANSTAAMPKPARPKADEVSISPTPSSSRPRRHGYTLKFAHIYPVAFVKAKSTKEYGSLNTKTPSVKSWIPKSSLRRWLQAPSRIPKLKPKSTKEYASQKTKTPSVNSRIPKASLRRGLQAPSRIPKLKPKSKLAPKDTRRLAATERTTLKSNSATAWLAGSAVKAAATTESRRQRNRVILGQVRSNRQFDLMLENRGITM